MHVYSVGWAYLVGLNGRNLLVLLDIVADLCIRSVY